MRAISTVLDVVVFLLLLSASVGTLTLAPDSEYDRVTVDETATVLATATTDLQYDVRAADRRAHGTLAILLGRAAIASATFRDHSLADPGDFRDQLRRRLTQQVIRENRTQLVAVWRPYRGGPVSGQVRIGSPPPPATDVTVASVSVPTPASGTRGRARKAAGDGFRAVAGVSAGAVTETLLPGSRLDASASTQSPTAVTSSARFRSFADALGISVDEALADGEVSLARQRVTDELTARFAADMRTRYASPTAAAKAVRPGSVEIAVRRWKP